MNARSGETPPRPSAGEPVSTKLLRINERARSRAKAQFTSLFHLMNEELLRDCFRRLSASSAAGADEVTKAAYAENLEAKLTDLVGRLQGMAYRPQPVRRVYIPKPGTDKLRPIGVPAFEDKLVQAGLVRILEAIYEQDFIADSFGFRPGRSCHDALRALGQTIDYGSINYVVEADLKSFFDTVDRGWMVRFLARRVADKRGLRMIERFLKAGVLEDGGVKSPRQVLFRAGSSRPCSRTCSCTTPWICGLSGCSAKAVRGRHGSFASRMISWPASGNGRTPNASRRN